MVIFWGFCILFYRNPVSRVIWSHELRSLSALCLLELLFVMTFHLVLLSRSSADWSCLWTALRATMAIIMIHTQYSLL